MLPQILCFTRPRTSELDIDLRIVTNMPSADPKPRTLYDKVFQDHIVDEQPDGTILLYIGTFLTRASGGQ